MAGKVVQTPTAQLYDLPIIGDDFAKVGRIIDMWSDPCKPTAEIWVYGFFQAFPTLFISLVKPELIDVNIHKGSHKSRRGKKFRMRPNAIFRDSLINIPVPNWRVFRIYEWSQRIGWYFLVADATETFAINWISTAYMWTGCTTGLQPYASLDNDFVLGHTQINGEFLPMNTTAVHDMTPLTSGAEVEFPGFYRASFNMTYQPYAVPSQSSLPERTELVYTPAGGAPIGIAPGETYTSTIGMKGTSGQGAVILCESGDRFQLRTYGAEGYFRSFGTMSVSNINNDPIAPDP